MIGVEDDLIAFVDRIRGVSQFKHVMLCGMGGSSLCPEVFRQTFGQQAGYPKLLVLDSTDPDAFCARFPTFQASLRRAIQAHEYLAANPGLLEEREAARV